MTLIPGTPIPVVIDANGPVATPAATLRQDILNAVASTNPGYTANLPGSLVEDILSTDTSSLAMIDQARVDAINSVSPYGANVAVLNQLGVQFGLSLGAPSNASVLVVFTGSAGYVLSPGFLVSDGTHQYALQDGGVIPTSGVSSPLFAVCTVSDSFAIPANTVTQIVTSVDAAYTMAVNNPQAGTPTESAESVESYRSRILQAGRVASVGTPAYLLTLLQAIIGVQSNRVSINQVSGGWQVICGGGDPYQVGLAMLQGAGDIALLTGSQLAITGMTNANPVVVTTNLNHGYAVGQTVVVKGATPSGFNVTYTIASVTAKTFTTTTNGSGFGTYTGGAKLTPNPRNVGVSIFQNPNIYNLTYVNPPAQVVLMSVLWNTTLPNFTAGASVNQSAAPALQSYINSIVVGQPINMLEMTAVFQEATSDIIDAINITTLTFTVTINGVVTSPSAGTSIITSDPESYFSASATAVTVSQA
ncbi:MAG TPA: baseplate J/gp47 family protein [Rhodanobacter sp.]|nr:baseplate J/gp47 family protein [Rhodanobacter sp.]